MRERKVILTDLIKHPDADLSELAVELGMYAWDTDESLYLITVDDIRNALQLFLTNQIDKQRLEDWANLVELRDGFEFENSELREIIHELATPLLFGELTIGKIMGLASRATGKR